MDLIINGADFSAVDYRYIVTLVEKEKGYAISGATGQRVVGANYVSGIASYLIADIDDITGYIPEQIVFFSGSTIGTTGFISSVSVNHNKETFLNALENAPSGAKYVALNFWTGGASGIDEAYDTPSYLLKNTQ